VINGQVNIFQKIIGNIQKNYQNSDVVRNEEICNLGSDSVFSSRRYLVYLTAIGAAVAVAGYPLKVTVDGYFYLSSARGIWTPQDSELYYWIREPAYPIFLKALHYFFGSSDVLLSVFQSFMMSGAIAVLLGSVVKPEKVYSKLLVVTFASSCFFVGPFFGYSSFVLKQAMMVSFVALAAVIVRFAFVVKHSRTKVMLLAALLAGAVIAPQVSITLKYLYVWPAFVVPWVIFMRQQRLKFDGVFLLSLSNFRKLFVAKAIIPLLLSLGTLAAIQFSESLWNQYKDKNASESEYQDYGFDESSALSNRITNPKILWDGIFSEIPILLMLAPTDNAGGIKENIFYTQIQADPAWLCGAYDGFVKEPYTTYGSWMEKSCRSREVQNLVRWLMPAGELFYQIVMIAAMLAPLVALVLRRWAQAAVFGTGLWFALTYAFANGFTIDRYGLPIFPFGVAAVAFFASETFTLGSKYFGRVRSQKRNNLGYTSEPYKMHQENV
jgi:hypothetical protein